jgi:dimethylhistidine N-methyltransferase
MSASASADLIRPVRADREASAHLNAFRADVFEGLAKAQKTLPSRWLYDDVGSDLFEQITALPEYYPTRTETAILTDHAEKLAGFCGSEAVMVEYGAGAIVKTEILLEALKAPRLYVPVDIAGAFLEKSADQLRARFPSLAVWPVVADFTRPFDLPDEVPSGHQRVAVFLGSTLGNLEPEDAVALLAMMRRHAASGGSGAPAKALIGIDLVKGTDVLIPAYDDAAGVTAAFNLNLLKRINRELDGTFDLSKFCHEVRWNADEAAIEMHLCATQDQRVQVGNRVFAFSEAETIHTESSRKYTVEAFAKLAARAGWQIETTWTDQNDYFALVGLTAAQRI